MNVSLNSRAREKKKKNSFRAELLTMELLTSLLNEELREQHFIER